MSASFISPLFNGFLLQESVSELFSLYYMVEWWILNSMLVFECRKNRSLENNDPENKNNIECIYNGKKKLLVIAKAGSNVDNIKSL